VSIGDLNPIDYPEAWDVIDVAGFQSPGVCEVSRPKRDYNWDIKPGKGTKGATTTFVGQSPAKWSVKFKAWLPRHFREWDEFLPRLKYDPNRENKDAYDVFYPALADLDIRSATTESVGGWEDEGGGLYSRTVEFLEYLPPAKTSVVSTPNGSADGDSDVGTQPDPARVALQKERDRLASEAQGAWK